MERLRLILNEAVGLIVDDGTLAIAVVAWTVLVGAASELAVLPAAWGAGALFVGLAAILVENALRRARRG